MPVPIFSRLVAFCMKRLQKENHSQATLLLMLWKKSFTPNPNRFKRLLKSKKKLINV